jgi:hypothetical protein
MAKSSLRQIVPSTRGLEVGSKPLDPNREKLSLLDLYFPCAATDRSICSRTIGGGVNGDDHHGAKVEMSAAEKIIAAGPIPYK